MYSPVVVAGSNTHHFKLSLQIYIYSSNVYVQDGTKATAKECFESNRKEEAKPEPKQNCGRPCPNFNLCQKYHPEFWVQAGAHTPRGEEGLQHRHPALRRSPLASGSRTVVPGVEHEGRPCLVRTPDVDSDKRDSPDVFSEGFSGPYPQDRRPNLAGSRSKSSGSLGQTVHQDPESKGHGILLPLKLRLNASNRQERPGTG